MPRLTHYTYIAYRVASRFYAAYMLYLHVLFTINLVTAAIEQCIENNSEQPTFISSTL